MIDKIEVEDRTYDINGGANIEVVEMSELTASKFRELSLKFLAGETQILLKEHSTVFAVNEVIYYEYYEDYSRWACSYIANEAADNAEPTPEIKFIEIQVTPDDVVNCISTRILPAEKLFSHTIKIDDSYFRGTFSFLCTRNFPFENTKELQEYAPQITATAILHGIQADMAGMGEDFVTVMRIEADVSEMKFYIIENFYSDPEDAPYQNLSYSKNVSVEDTVTEVS